ncbi:hypothetical protein COT78_00090 [Candidatus Berkelbacteria bacterium CG10_big_fil_rev_8_21_14_0_10_43_13]|uniref:Uncharacterized protein n=1 Tax=Candidatus Berkelbacteria bacterium CG10_big_fil_rev_8_21_14_0_10_43_13 TaxID=1974514 RepID=A0A2H0W9Q2_9BACT|nr:MAG: hypothetical protein COT78_00090 [Candidatus Berkelbacteria bacterium CG10_big_fil_rev_8_21_14_0_10_43_13]
MKFKKIILLLFSIIFFGCFWGSVSINHARAAFEYTYDKTYENFHISNIGQYVDVFDFKDAPFASLVVGTDPSEFGKPGVIVNITLPKIINIDTVIDNSNIGSWTAIAELYDMIPQTEENILTEWYYAQQNVANIYSAIQTYMEGNNTSGNSIALSPAAFTVEKSTTITGYYANYLHSARTCFLYVGDGRGKYWSKGSKAVDINNGKCEFIWESSADTAVGHHAVFITFREADDLLLESTYSENITFLPFPNVYDVFNVCAKGKSSCNDISDTGSGGRLIVNNNTLTTGKSPNPTFSMYISDPNKAKDYATQGKICYFYIGDGAGKWIEKGKSPVSAGSPNCSYTWDFSGTAPGGHGFIVNIFDKDTGDITGDQNLSTNVVKVTVCAAGTTDCKDDGKPIDNGGTDPGDGGGGGGGSGGGGSTIGSFDGSVSGNDFMKWLNGKITTLEGAFDYYVLTNIIGLVAFIAIIVGGVMLLTAGGDPAKATKGKKTLSYAALALIFGALSYGIVTYVVNLVNTR